MKSVLSLLRVCLTVAMVAVAMGASAQAEIFLYDSTGRLQRAIQPDGPSASFGYDYAGNVSGAATAQPQMLQIGQAALLSLAVNPFVNPASMGLTVKVDLSALGGSSQTGLNDSGLNGDLQAGDGIYSASFTPGAGAPLGTQLLGVSITDSQGRSGQDYLAVTNSAAVPALPLWGWIVLGGLLLAAGARALPRQAVAVLAMGSMLACFTARASAQLPYPVWENVPMDMAEFPAVVGVPPPERPAESNTPAGLALSVPQSLDVEIVALATALGTGGATTGEEAGAKAVRIFNWVRNNIQYEHYYGLRKGAALTFLEGSGNDFDQSILLADLLVAAGYPTADIKLRLRGQRVDYSYLMTWMGLAQEPYPGKTFFQAFGQQITQVFPNGQDQGVGDFVAKQAVFAGQFLSTRGSRFGGANGAGIWFPDFPGKANLLFNRVYVQLTVGGVAYDLDPSYKTYETIVAANDLLAGAGYSRASILSAAAGSGDASSTSGLNQTSVDAYLAGRTTQLLGQLNGAWRNLTLGELVNSRRIVRQDIAALSEAFALPKVFYDTGLTFNSTTDASLAPYKTTVRFQTPGIDYTIPASDLKGRKITLTFSGNNVELRLDDAAPVATTSVAGSSLSLTITVTHPGSIGAKSETKIYRKSDAFAYAILYGFTPSGRLVQKRYEQLRTYLDEGKSDTSREVRTELLNIMGMTWLYQTELCNRLISAKNNVLPIYHHRFGRMGQEEGFYVDVGLQLTGSYPNDASSTDSGSAARFDNVFHLGSLYASALEHGIIEQMQPGSSAVSTVNILRKANSTSGNALFLARAANWSTVQNLLVGYTAQQKTDFGTLINSPTAPAQMFLPKNASVTQGNWTGSGWVIRSRTQAGMIINGGYSGGYSTAPAPVVSPPFQTSYNYNPVTTYTAPSAPVYSPPPAPSVPRSYSSDPVDMATGAFTFAADDLNTGIEGAPRGLSFSRYYSSNEATRDSQNLGFGWSHNLHIRAEERSAAEVVLGDGTPQTTARFLVSMLAAADLYRADATPKEWGVATLAVGWLVDNLKDNAVAIRIGKETFQFLGQPDGTYAPPAGSTLTLSKVSNAYLLKQRLGNTIHFFPTGNAHAGKAEKIVDVDGKAMTFDYNGTGTLNYIQDSNARRFTFGYSGTRIATLTDSTAPARSISFGYDASGNLIRATDPELKNSWFDYVLAGDPGNTLVTEHRIVRLRNHDLETITQNVWDSLGRVEKQFLHGDTTKTFRLYYTGPDNYEVNPEGGLTHFYFDSRGRPAGQRDPNGHLFTLSYDAQERVNSRTSDTGEVTGYIYDGNGNLTQVNHPRGGGSTVLAYDSLNRLDLLTDPHGVQTDYVYFPSGIHAGKDRPQSVIAAKGTADQSTTTYQYIDSGAAIGRVWKITDGDNLVTENAYDSLGQPDWTKAPGGFLTDFTYTPRGDLDFVLDPKNIKTDYSYNLRRQVTATVQDQGGADTGTEDRAYDNQARLQASTAPSHNGGLRVQGTFTYTPTDKVRLEKLAGVTVADHAYDRRDWEATVKDAALRQTTLVRKANGSLEQTQRPGARTTTFSYDGDQRLTSSVNPGANRGNRAAGFVYDTSSGGFPRTIFTGNDGLAETSIFDRLGRLRFLTDKRTNTFEFRYDTLGRRTQVLAPGRPAALTGYTKNGRVKTVTEPSGDTAALGYNATTGRLATATYTKAGGASSTVNYTSYDNNGNVLALNENGAGGITRTYDNLGRVKSCTGPNGTIGYRYYPSGQLWKLIYPGGNDTTGHVEYTYWPDGRLRDVIDKLGGATRTSTYTWRTDGRLQSVARPNGTVRTITYDAAGRPDSITERSGGTAFLSYSIGYYPSDDLQSLTVTPLVSPNLLTALPAASMGFDAANRLTSFNGTTVVNDADGNMTSGPLANGAGFGSYVYDSRNRLTSAGGLNYAYDAEGNRIGITGNETTSLLVDPAGGLPKVLSRTKNGVTTRYVYGAGLLYEVSSSNVATYYHYDQSGNTAALTNASGSVIERVEYSPYGFIRYRQNNFDTPFLFGGFFGVMTDANKLIHMRARYYHPLTMRFLTSDPAQDTWNWYAYANGNPLAFADPSGFGSSSVLNAVQTGLSFLGFVPVFGAIADVVNAGISVARGNYGEAALNLASAVPGIGDAFAAGKIAVTGVVAYKAVQVVQTARTAATVERIAAKTGAAAESRMVTVLGSGRDISKGAYAGKPGFNVLNMDALPEAEWARTNAEWLNAAMRRGDDLWLVTDPAKHTKLMQQLGKESYYLDLELLMLEQFGAKAVPKFP